MGRDVNIGHCRWLIRMMIQAGWTLDLVEVISFVNYVLEDHDYPRLDGNKICYGPDFQYLDKESQEYIDGFLNSLA